MDIFSNPVECVEIAKPTFAIFDIGFDHISAVPHAPVSIVACFYVGLVGSAAFNVLPRIALVPLFILWFGLGIGSKIALGVSLTFFIVLSSTVAGIRGVSQDHVTLTRTLGASSRQMFFSVTLPGAVPVLFSGLRLGVIYALLGVVGAEVIASERGLGQQLAYLGSTFNVNGVWSLLFDLAVIGVLIMKLMNWIERRLLHWQ